MTGVMFVHMSEQRAAWGWTAGRGLNQNDLVTLERPCYGPLY